MAANIYSNQIQNRNFLSPVGFKFTIAKEPKVAFFCNTARIPEITLPTTTQPSYLKDIDIPGEKLSYGDLNLRFLVDENLENYMKVHNWLTGLGYPETTDQFAQLAKNKLGIFDEKAVFSDGSLHILDSNYQDVAIVKFRDLFPVSLSSLDFDATMTDIQYFTAEVSFKYTIYDILAPNSQPL
jgi:hypothetical protein